MKKIKTFEAACKALNIAAVLPDVTVMPAKHAKAFIAHYKLVIIVEALNAGWVPDWNNTSEYKYFPWWDMESGFVLYGVNYYGTLSHVGSRLCFQTRTLAEYAAKQFKELYKDYMAIE